MINPQLLHTFCTLAELGHFTRTAQALNMTQSGVSQHLAKLEQQLQQSLVNRQGKHFTLTGAGRELLIEGRQLLQSLEALEKRFVEDDPHIGRVRIMSPGSVGLLLYPQLLALQCKFPELVIDYRFAPNGQIAQALQNAELDIGLTTVPISDQQIESRALSSEPLHLVTAGDVTINSWHDLQSIGFVDHPDGAHHASVLLRANFSEFSAVHQFRCAGFSNQIGLVLEPVALGLGFTVLPARAVTAFADAERIRVQPLAVQCEEQIYLSQLCNADKQKRIAFVTQRIIELLVDS